MILLDTHVLIWWLSNPEKLTKRALDAIDKAKEENSILISSITVWEILMLVKKNRLSFNIEAKLWIDRVEKLPFITFVSVDNQILKRSVLLNGDLHSDPADRIIIATALETKATLITADEKILKYKGVKTLW